MPELPEVEIVRRTLAPHLLGRKIINTEIYLDRMIKHPSPKQFISEIKCSTINNILRRGKYLIISFDNQKLLIIHLRMTGALLASESEEAPPYAKIKFKLSDGNYLWYTDIRTFGTLYLVNTGENIVKGLSGLGPEPTKDQLKLSYLKEIFGKRKAPVKSVLLDQTAIAGLGNIYVDEALATSGIKPDRKANELTEKEIKKLHKAIIDVIAKGIENGGTTFRDYKDGEGKKGSNQNYLLVYGRSGQACNKCGSIIEYTRVAGRGTSYCPKCQV